MTQAELVIPAQDLVGESIVWDDRTGTLAWVDIGGRRIHRLDPATGDHRLWPLGFFPTSIGLRTDGGAILGRTRDVVLWDWGGPFHPLATPEPDLPQNRLNEGRVAPDGSFWVGTMSNNLAPDGSPMVQAGTTGALYRIAPDGTVTRLSEDRFGITNTMVWLDDGRFVTADTLANALYAYDVTPEGLLGARAAFGPPVTRGLPDGSCRDAEGAVWTCRVVGGAAVTRTLPDGTLDRVVELPCSWPTSCTFGGPALDTLFVTSARFTMTPDHLAAHPQEGGLFALRPGVRGQPEPRFGAAIRKPQQRKETKRMGYQFWGMTTRRNGTVTYARTNNPEERVRHVTRVVGETRVWYMDLECGQVDEEMAVNAIDGSQELMNRYISNAIKAGYTYHDAEQVLSNLITWVNRPRR